MMTFLSSCVIASSMALPPEPCVLGDVNGDGNVNGIDLAQILHHWGTSEISCDIDGSGLVDEGDLSLVLIGWVICEEIKSQSGGLK